MNATLSIEENVGIERVNRVFYRTGSILSVGQVIRGGIWLYLGGLSLSFLGYVYWLIASSFIPPNIVGTAAAVIALQSLIVGIFSFGLPTGLQYFIGVSKGKNDYQQLSAYFFTSFAFVFLTSTVMALGIFLVSLTDSSFFSLSSFELRFIAIFILLGSGAWTLLFTSLFNSLLKTEVTALALTISSFARLLIGVPLLYFGFEFVGVMFGFLAAFIALDAILLFQGARLFYTFRIKPRISISFLRGPFKAGLASWIPNTLTLTGQSIAVLSVYGFVGGTEAGLYFVAFAIASLVSSLPASVLGLMFPVLSGMEDGRKRAISRAIKLSLALTAPISLALALYPSIPLSLLGTKYTHAADMLRVLALGIIVSPIVSGYTSYVYAAGKYIHVTLIGLMANGGRLILYALLVPFLGELGAAASYALGFFIALTAIPPSALKIGYRVNWLESIKILAIPTSLTIALFFLNAPWVIALPILLLSSLLAYTRLGIVTKSDLLEVSQAFLSRDSVSRMYSYTRPLIRLMYGE